MSSFPCLAVQERFATISVRPLVFNELSKVRTHKIVVRIDIKLLEKKLCSPWGILDVDNSQSRFTRTLLLSKC